MLLAESSIVYRALTAIVLAECVATRSTFFRVRFTDKFTTVIAVEQVLRYEVSTTVETLVGVVEAVEVARDFGDFTVGLTEQLTTGHTFLSV
jgi:hypothetical protein